ncbi:MAG: TonB C-terminal domain-containing protein [Bdellovibrionaceae bacterium]|nr:TonB C-terminal domain-containing protein [Pseudobdellovibrionaceae bacterium]
MKNQKRQNVPTDQNSKKSVSFIIISLLVHFLLALSFTEYSDYLSLQVEPVSKKEDTSIQFVEMADLDKMRGELAELDKQNQKKPAKDAKFLSEKDNAVEKETKAAQRGEFQNKKNVESSKASASAQQAQQQQAAPSEKTPEMETFAYGDMPVPTQKPKKAKTISDLRANSMQEMSQSAANDASQTNDYLKDVAIGAETHLNAREFLYYTYFNRIKKKLRQHWEPLIHTRVRDMVKGGRQIASTGAKVTRLVITLDENGGLSKVQVSTTSGLMDLDDVAIEALRVSAPFPNPPKDLIENGYVRINWDFILES